MCGLEGDRGHIQKAGQWQLGTRGPELQQALEALHACPCPISKLSLTRPPCHLLLEALLWQLALSVLLGLRVGP